MSMAERNKAIKAIVSKAFAPHKVTVKGSRGTAYGWVTVHIGYTPRNNHESQELRAQVNLLIKGAKIEIGTYGYDDPGSDYGYGSTINISFDRCREQADQWGPGALAFPPALFTAGPWRPAEATPGARDDIRTSMVCTTSAHDNRHQHYVN